MLRASCYRAATVSFCATLLWAECGLCADVDEWSLSGSGSVRMAYWSGSRRLDDREHIGRTELWLRGRVDTKKLGSIMADGWVAAETGDVASADRSDVLRGKRTDRIREFYWKITTDSVDLRIGRQLILWGRADAINPTDSLTPQDFTLLNPFDSGQRFGNFAVQMSYLTEDYALRAVWVPEFHTDIVPLLAVPSVSYRYLTERWQDQYAFKLDRSSGAVDWSISYFDGYGRRPDIALLAIAPEHLVVGVSNPRVRVFGFDASLGAGPYVVRTESAWRKIRASADESARQHSSVEWVIGGERSFLERLDVNVQYFAKWTADFVDPRTVADPILRGIALQEAVLTDQTRAFRHGVTLRAAYRWDNDTWEAELSGLAAIGTGDSVFRAQVTHAPNDRIKANLGIERFRGPPFSPFGYLQDNSTVHLELRYSF